MIEGLADRLKKSRANANYTRKQAASLIGVSESLIGLYESGVRQPSLATLIKLASWYKVSTDYLLGCETLDTNLISIDGLSDKQKQAIKLTLQVFRS